MNIIQMKQEIKDIRAELAAEIDKGMEMAKNRATTLESIKAQSDKVDDLQIREALLMQALNTAEGKENPPQSKKLGQNGGFRSLGEFASAVHNACTLNATVDSRLVRNDASGANETTGADGGYLVPPDYAAGVIDLIQEQSILLPQARRVTIAGNRLIEAYLVESKRDDGHRHGGVLAYWKGEAQQYKASKPTFDERTTQLDKLTAICPVTEELLMDEPAIESTLDTKVAQEFAWKADAAIFGGSGSGSMPLGMVVPTTNAALVTVDKESGQAAGTVNVQNILKMWNRMPAQCRANAKWYINQDLELQLMQLMMGTDTVATSDSGVTVSFGGPLWLPAGAYGNENGKLLGRDVIPLEQAAAVGAVGDIAFLDATQYLIVERAGINKQTSMHMYFDTDEVAFKFSWRVGGRPDWMTAITGANSTIARSPYVALAARA
nr:MAG TPA: major capsid protein [Caudoviricetes sp.]